MHLEAIYHRSKLSCYGYDEKTAFVTIRTKRDDVERIDLFYGDKCLPWDEMKTESMYIYASDQLFDYWELGVQPPFGRLAYAFIIQSGDQQLWFTEDGFSPKPPKVHWGLFEYPFLHENDMARPPAWVKDAVFYQIFVERFANGDPSNDPPKVQAWGGKPEYDNYFGGDLQGVIDHLDHLQQLGITAIYFTPIFEAKTNHKYDTEDYLKIDPAFGDLDTLKSLVKACHERGIRVVLDAVFNHSGRTFAPFLDVSLKGESSEYADWFYVREWPIDVKNGKPTYATFAFERHMPKLNTKNKELRDYLLKVARFWIEECDIDGWRLDVANEVDHEFWRDFRKEVKRAKPDAYILGEVWHDAQVYLQGDQFDAVMNYPLSKAILDYFVFQHDDAVQFADKIGHLMARYAKQSLEACFNQLDSHDTVRLLTLCKDNVDIMKLAVLFQFTFIGAPCIYYGSEVGVAGEFDPDNRRCMPWDPKDQNLDLFQFYQSIIQLRKEHEVLRSGAYSVLQATSDSPVFAYERKLNGERFVMILNRQQAPYDVFLAVGNGQWKDALTGETLSLTDGVYKEKLPSYGYRVLYCSQ